MSGSPDSQAPEQPQLEIEERSADEAVKAEEAWHAQFLKDQNRMAEARAKQFKKWEDADYPFELEELAHTAEGYEIPSPDHLNYLMRQAISEHLRRIDKKLAASKTDEERSAYEHEQKVYTDWHHQLWADRPQARGVPGYHVHPEPPSRDSE